MKHIIAILTLSLFLMLFLSGCSKPSHRANNINPPNRKVIDVNNFDPLDFTMEAQKEFKAREKTEVNKFYLLGHEKIEFRPVLNSMDDAENQSDFEWLKDLQGNKHLVAKKPVIDSSDIEGVLISHSVYKGIERNDMSIVFKKTSWDKVRDITGRLEGKRLGILKSGQLLFAPSLFEAVDSAVGGPIDDILDVDSFIDGFILTDLPSEEQSEKDYIDWLEKRDRMYPDDMNIISKLAYHYMNKKVEDCEKTLHIYNKILFDDVFRFPYMIEINKCYKISGNYDDVISTYNKLLNDMKHDSWEEASIRGFLADMLFENGRKEESLKELHTAVQLVESSTLDYEWIERSAHRDKIRREFEEKKEGLVKTFKAMITMVEDSE